MMLGHSRNKAEDRREPKGPKPKLSENEKRIIYIFAVAALVVVAAASLLVTGSAARSGIQSCSGIILQQQRSACFSSIAVSTKNASICGSIPDKTSRYQCINYIAQSLLDVGTCGLINSSSPIYGNCVQNVTTSTGNISYCSILKEPQSSSCAYGIAQKEKFSDLSSCNAIGNSTLRDSCIGAHYYDKAITTSSASYCGLIPGTSNSSVLHSILSQANFSDPEQFLEYTSINVSPRNYCYYRIATLTYNKSACAPTTGLLSVLCNETFSNLNKTVQYNSSAACGSVPPYLQAVCQFGFYTQQALSNRNVTDCTMLSSQSYRYSCISALAASAHNSSYCGYITNSTSRQSCLSSVSNSTNSTHA